MIRRLLLALALAASLAAPAGALAADASSPSPRATGPRTAERLQDVQRRGDDEIARRLRTLDDLAARLAKAKGLTDADRTTLQGSLNTDRSGLTALRAKLDAETTVGGAEADVRQVVSGYRVYAVFEPEARMAIGDDTLLAACATRLPKVEQELATATSKLGGSEAQARLADLQAQVRTACADATAAHQEIMGLAAAGWPGNRSSIQDARAKLRAAETALKAALADAHALVAMLRAQRSPSPTPTG